MDKEIVKSYTKDGKQAITPTDQEFEIPGKLVVVDGQLIYIDKNGDEHVISIPNIQTGDTITKLQYLKETNEIEITTDKSSFNITIDGFLQQLEGNFDLNGMFHAKNGNYYLVENANQPYQTLIESQDSQKRPVANVNYRLTATNDGGIEIALLNDDATVNEDGSINDNATVCATLGVRNNGVYWVNSDGEYNVRSDLDSPKNQDIYTMIDYPEEGLGGQSLGHEISLIIDEISAKFPNETITFQTQTHGTGKLGHLIETELGTTSPVIVFELFWCGGSNASPIWLNLLPNGDNRQIGLIYDNKPNPDPTNSNSYISKTYDLPGQDI